MNTPPQGLPTPAPVRSRKPVVRPLTMVAGVGVVLVLLLAPYVRPWVAQRSQIADGGQRVRQLQDEVDALARERRRWDDPAYVRAQARQRFQFVMPGETGFVVLDDGAKPAATADPRTAGATLAARSADQSWYARLWDSVRIAGDPTTQQARSAPAR